MLKKLTKNVLIIMAMTVFGLLFCSCGGKPTIGVYPQTVEQGMYLALPEVLNVKEYEVSAKKPNGKSVRVSNNRVLMEELGDYTFTYTYSGKEKSIKVKCVQDKTGPYISKDISLDSVYYMGEEVYPFGLLLKDPSGFVDYEWEYYFEDETVKLNQDGTDSIFPDRAGNYKLILRSWDRYGNESLFEYSFKVEELFIDEDIVETVNDELQYKTRADGTVLLADFDNIGYANNYISSGDTWGTATKSFSIVNESIEGVDKQVLRGEPYKRGTEHFILNYEFFKPFTPVKQNNKPSGYFYIRYKIAQRLTEEETIGMPSYDYLPQIYGVPIKLPGSMLMNYIEYGNDSFNFNPKDSVWSVARIPVSYFCYNGETTLNGIRLCICGEIYLDEIWYDQSEFKDTNKQSNVLMDFDEEEYLYQIGAGNIGDPAYTEILTSEELADIDQDVVDVVGHDSGMLLIASKDQRYRWATAIIKLFDEVVASENTKIQFTIYYDGRIDDEVYSNLIIMNKDLKNFKDDSIYDNPIDSSNGYQFFEKWATITVDSLIFAKEGERFDEIMIQLEGKLYIDEIVLITDAQGG